MSVIEYEIYRRIKLLGEGAFGKAYLVECLKDNSLCVIKQVDLNKMPEHERRDTIKEAKILEALKHPNIIRFREVYKTKKGKLCIVMDYADGGDLAKKVAEARGSYIQENKILDWFTQMCLALKHVHDRKIIHRDLKCQNIFLTKNGMIKLGDFGIARVLNHTKENARTMVGTPYYLSPEIIDNKPYSFKSDIWSLGVILYELCALKPPFDAESLPKLAMKIVRGIYNPLPSQYSRELKNLVSMMLVLDPAKRPSVNEILKLPLIKNRIRGFLSESVHLKEFSHTILHKQKIVDPYVMKFDEIKQVLKEEPIPMDMLRLQMLKEKKEKEAQEKLEKEKLERIEKQQRLEREKAEREKMEQEKREREKLEQELREKEKDNRIQKIKNMMQLPPEKERDRSPLLRNAFTPASGNPKPSNKLELPNSPFTPGLLVRNKPYDNQPRTPNYPCKNDNVFNPFLKNNERSELKKVEIKPILYAAPTKEPQSVRGEKSPFLEPKKSKEVIGNKSSEESKPADLKIEGSKFGEEKPSVSPRNIFVQNNLKDAVQADKLKDNKAKEAEERNRKIAEVIKEGKKKREQYKNQLDALKREDEQKKQEIEKLLLEKKKEREEDRKKMIEDINQKRKSLKAKERDAEIDVEVYIPQADSDDDDEVDERERDFDSKEEEKEEIAGSKESEDGTTNEKLTMEEANLIEMINEMQKIVDEVEEFVPESEGERPPSDDPVEESEDPNTPLKDISNRIDFKTNIDPQNINIQTLIDEKIAPEKSKAIIDECSKRLISLLENIDMPIEDHYARIRDDIMGSFQNENTVQSFPLLLYKALTDI